MKSVRIKNRSRAADIYQCKVYHTTVSPGNLLTTAVSSSGVFTGLDLFNGIIFQVDDNVDQFLIQTITLDGCTGDLCSTCSNIGSGSISGDLTNVRETYYLQPGQFGRIDYDGEFSGSVTSTNDIDLTGITHNFTPFPTLTLTSIPDTGYFFEAWYDNAARTGTPLTTDNPVVIDDGGFGGSTSWYVKYANNEPVFRFNAIDGALITAFVTSSNENSGPHEIAKFYYSDADGDTLNIDLSPDADGHFNLTQYTNYVSLEQVTASLDYENITSYSMSISASDGTTTTIFPITVNVIDNAPPTAVNLTLGNFGENPSGGDTVGFATGSVSDAENDSIIYVSFVLDSLTQSGKDVDISLYGGTSHSDPTPDPFEMSNTGVISFTAGGYLNRTLIDSYTYTLTAKDDFNSTLATSSITIPIVADANTIVITGDGDNLVYVVESAVNGDDVYDDTSGYQGDIADFVANHSVTWSISDPNSILDIDASGNLSVTDNVADFYVDGDTFTATITATGADGRYTELDITVVVTPDASAPTISGFGTSSIAYIIESGQVGDAIRYSATGYTGPQVQLTADQTVTWSTDNSIVDINTDGYLSLGSTISGSSFEHPNTMTVEAYATNTFGTAATASFTLTAAENQPPAVSFDDTFTTPTDIDAVAGATLVTASFTDPEGDTIQHNEFNLTDASGQLSASRDGDIYYIQSVNTLSASIDYPFEVDITDIHGFSRGSGSHTISITSGQRTAGILSGDTSVFIRETSLSGDKYEATKGFGTGATASLDVTYSPNIGSQTPVSFTSLNPAIAVDNSGILTLGLDVSAFTSASGDTYTGSIEFADQYGNVGSGSVNVTVTYPNSGSYLRYEVVPQSLGSVSGSIDEDGLYNSASFNLYAQYVEDGTKVAFKTGSTNSAVIDEDYTLSGTEFEIINQTGSIILTAIDDEKGEQGFEAASLILQDYTGGGGFPYYDSAGNVVLEDTSNPEKPLSRTVVIQDTSRSYLSLVSDKTTANEGDTVTFTLTSQNVTDGTEVLIDYPAGSSNTATRGVDYTMSSDRFVINSNTATLTATITNDLSTEGTEYFRIQLQDQDSEGNYTYNLDKMVTINDTSLSTNPLVYIYEHTIGDIFDVKTEYTASYVDSFATESTDYNNTSENPLEFESDRVRILNAIGNPSQAFSVNDITNFKLEVSASAAATNPGNYNVAVIRHDSSDDTYTEIVNSNNLATGSLHTLTIATTGQLSNIPSASNGDSSPSSNITYLAEIQAPSTIVMDTVTWTLNYNDELARPKVDTVSLGTTWNSSTVGSNDRARMFERTMGTTQTQVMGDPTFRNVVNSSIISGSLHSNLQSGSIGDSLINLSNGETARLLASGSVGTYLESALQNIGTFNEPSYDGQIVVIYPSSSASTYIWSPQSIETTYNDTLNGGIFHWNPQNQGFETGSGEIHKLELETPLEGHSHYFVFGSAQEIGGKVSLEVNINNTTTSV